MAELRRVLGLPALILLSIGAVIGSGVFVNPGVVLRESGGSVPVALAVWTAGGVLSLLGALTYGELGAMMPEAGGLYTYIRDAFGRLAAFLYGWTLFFVLGSGGMATLAVAGTAYLGELLPLSPVAAKAVALAMLAVIAVVNVLGTRESSGVQNGATLAKVGAIVVMSGLLIALGPGAGAAPAAAPAEPLSGGLTFAGVGAAMIGVLWAYEGWAYVTHSAGETIDPQRNFPRGIAIGTAALIAIYVLANVGYIAALGADGVAASRRAAAEAVTAVLGPVWGKVIAAVIVLSIFSAANGIVLTIPRAFFAMARDRVFFARLGEVHPRFGTPANAIVAVTLWAMVLTATGTFEQLFTYVVFSGWIFYGLGALTVFTYRRRQPNVRRPFRVPGYPLTPLLFVISAAALVLNTIATQPFRAAAGLGVVLTGVPAYLIWRRR